MSRETHIALLLNTPTTQNRHDEARISSREEDINSAVLAGVVLQESAERSSRNRCRI
jgi:hypothetical protein